VSSHRLVASVVPMVGEHVIMGAPLVWVWRPTELDPVPAPSELAAAVRDALRIGFERTMEQDAAFGVRQLADVASKALSPAVNDPYTAVQALDHLSVILCALAGRRAGHQQLVDRQGVLRLVIPGRDFGYYVELACGQIRRYGCAEPRVVSALLRALHDTAYFCTDEAARGVIAHQIQLVLADAERAIAQPADLSVVLERGQRALAQLGSAG
jgi:uncharacterized membrane protein